MRNLYDNIIYPDKNIFLDETGYSRSVYISKLIRDFNMTDNAKF